MLLALLSSLGTSFRAVYMPNNLEMPQINIEILIFSIYSFYLPYYLTDINAKCPSCGRLNVYDEVLRMASASIAAYRARHRALEPQCQYFQLKVLRLSTCSAIEISPAIQGM